eukprot:264336_1
MSQWICTVCEYHQKNCSSAIQRPNCAKCHIFNRIKSQSCPLCVSNVNLTSSYGFDCKKNTKKLYDIIASFQEIEQHITNSEDDLLKPSNVYFVPDSINCKLLNCIHLRVLITVLKQQMAGEITMNNKTILNSFEHLQSQHSTEFEDIYEIITIKFEICDKANCIHIRRNYRSKTDNTEQQSIDIVQTVTRKILDSIHCYYFHSFDMGYRLRRQEFFPTVLSDKKRAVDR